MWYTLGLFLHGNEEEELRTCASERVWRSRELRDTRVVVVFGVRALDRAREEKSSYA